MIVRDASRNDIRAITVIYNDAVQHTTAIWNDTIVDESNRDEWLSARLANGYPVIVAVNEADEVLGYASFGDWRAFDGYRFTVEHSVYVRGDARGGGIGRALMKELIERARTLGKHAMIAGIEAGNVGSIRLHEALNFETVGVMREVGTKFGNWLDLAFMQLNLDKRRTPEDREG